MPRWLIVTAVALAAAAGFALWPSSIHAAAPGSLNDFTVTDIDGAKVPLSTYKGKVVLVVNTASECGFTPQYKGLEKLYKSLESKGFVILGFPCNDFGGQEPGSSAQIKAFCTSKYSVTFPMFAKVKVTKGPDQAPLYTWLTSCGKSPSWNFCKYLIGRDGQIIEYYSSMTGPDSSSLRKAIEKALEAKG